MSHFNSGSSAFNASNYDNVEHLAFATQQRSYNSEYQPRSYNIGHNTGNNFTNPGNTSFPPNSSYKSNTRFESQDRLQQIFCDHCKMTRNTIQRCYKIHGYPPGHKLYKGKRVAAVAQTYSSSRYNVVQP